MMKAFLLLIQSSICKPFRELKNPGASGSLFYVTADDEFIIKTVQKKEARFLRSLLPGYYMVTSILDLVLPRRLLPFIVEYYTKSTYASTKILRSLLLSGIIKFFLLLLNKSNFVNM